MSAAPPPSATEQFFTLLDAALARRAFVRLVLGRHCGPEPELVRVTIRPIALRGAEHLSFVYRYKTRDITSNLPPDQGVALLRELIGDAFRNAHLLTADEELQLTFSRRGKPLLHRGKAPPNAAADPAHDREKRRFVELERPFLSALGVTDAQRRLIPSMSRKWKQINKFIEVFEGAFDRSPLARRRAVEVVDFGAGKGYLTFAIHNFLRHTRELDARVTGVELRPDLVRLCNDAAGRLALDGLAFEQGDVRSRPPAAIDVMIALHACDTATDYAIHAGIRAQATIIMCAPCCHKQLRPQMRPPPVLQPMLRYGVHRGQEAEMLTDALRALLLDAHGYDTQLFEFIAPEHTEKNKMILAVRRARPVPRPEILAQIAALKTFYGIKEQCLESLLTDAPAPTADCTCAARRP